MMGTKKVLGYQRNRLSRVEQGSLPVDYNETCIDTVSVRFWLESQHFKRLAVFFITT